MSAKAHWQIIDICVCACCEFIYLIYFLCNLEAEWLFVIVVCSKMENGNTVLYQVQKWKQKEVRMT